MQEAAQGAVQGLRRNFLEDFQEDFREFSAPQSDSGIVAGSSLIFEKGKHFSIDRQGEGYVLQLRHEVVIPVSELKGQGLRGHGRNLEVHRV